MKYLITGGGGFLGTNLAAKVLKRGDGYLFLTIYAELVLNKI